MKTRDCSCVLNVLVGGRPVTEYEHQGNVFIEGRKGSDFEIEYRNETRHRVLVIPAVDGKSVLDGKPASPDSKGYIVKPWASIKIPGWTLDNNQVAKFTFEDKEKSYAARTSDGSWVQAGVIGVLVFKEEEPKPQPYVWNPNTLLLGGSQPYYNGQPYNNPSYTATTFGAATLNSADIKGVSSAATRSVSDVVPSNVAQPEGAFEMGTGFGQRTDFKTNEVKFNKGELTAQMVLYYDSRRNLEKRGIQVVRRETRYLTDLPQAFQGTGCTPPPGWQG